MSGVGYRFRPNIEFLIKILQYKTSGGGDISGCTKVPGDLSYLDMYGSGKEPWNVFSGDHEISEFHDVGKMTIKEKYVLTKLNKIGKKNVSRTAGTGSWDDQSTAKPVMVGGGHDMGHWRTLTYEYWGGDGAEEDKCYYYMNELHLSEHALAEARSWNKDKTSDDYYVICRVLKNEEKRCRNRPGSRKRPVDKPTAKDCPAPKKSRDEEIKKSGHVNQQACFSGPKQSVPLYDSKPFGVAQNDEQRSMGFYSALLHSRDYPELGDHGNLNSDCCLTLPTRDDFQNPENWKQYTSSAFIDLDD